jgi:hypothetical protein
MQYVRGITPMARGIYTAGETVVLHEVVKPSVSSHRRNGQEVTFPASHPITIFMSNEIVAKYWVLSMPSELLPDDGNITQLHILPISTSWIIIRKSYCRRNAGTALVRLQIERSPGP